MGKTYLVEVTVIADVSCFTVLSLNYYCLLLPLLVFNTFYSIIVWSVKMSLQSSERTCSVHSCTNNLAN